MKKREIQRATNYVMAVLFFCSVTMNLTACSKAPSSTSGNANLSSSTGTGGGTTSTGGNPVSTIANDWSQVDTQGYSTGSFWGNTQIITIDQATETLTIQIPLEVNFLGIGLSNEPIPDIPGATVSLIQNANGLTSLAITLPLEDLVKGINFTQSTTLPNGNPLPAIPGGELPSIAAHIQDKNLNLYVYGSIIYFAVFIPIPSFNPYVNLTFPIKNAAGTSILGYLATVTPVGSNAGGMYFAMVFPASLQRLLDDLFPN